MNKTLNALMIKLKWQLTEVQQQLAVKLKEINEVDAQLHAIVQRMLKASSTPSVILPEKEIASLHFIMAQQQQHDEHRSNKVALMSEQEKLQTKKIRLDTELRMLEKYQERQLKIRIQQDVSREQYQTDEWIVQRGIKA